MEPRNIGDGFVRPLQLQRCGTGKGLPVTRLAAQASTSAWFNNSTRVTISHTLQGQAVAFFFLVHPGGQGLLNDPGARTIHLCG